jgi:hypothetical protein
MLGLAVSNENVSNASGAVNDGRKKKLFFSITQSQILAAK